MKVEQIEGINLQKDRKSRRIIFWSIRVGLEKQ